MKRSTAEAYPRLPKPIPATPPPPPPPMSTREFAAKWIADHQPEPLKCDKCGEPMRNFSACAMPSGAAWLDQCRIGGMHSYTITVKAFGDNSEEIEALAGALEAYTDAKQGRK